MDADTDAHRDSGFADVDRDDAANVDAHSYGDGDACCARRSDADQYADSYPIGCL